MRPIRKGDEVIVRAGRDKGTRGLVKKMVDKNRAIVEGINLVKRHTRPNPNKQIAGGILSKEAPIHISNIGIYNPVTKKADRVGIKTLEDKRKVRIFRSNKEVVDV